MSKRNAEQNKKRADQRRAQYKDDPEYARSKRDAAARYYEDNREAVLARIAVYAEANRAAISTRGAARYQRDPDSAKAAVTRRARDRKIRSVQVKGGRCERCGYDRHPAALQFHHRDPSTKQFTISTAVNKPGQYPWEAVLDEIAKCDLLCANCHSEVGATWTLDDSEWKV